METGSAMPQEKSGIDWRAIHQAVGRERQKKTGEE
jgi:hypothetical protein